MPLGSPPWTSIASVCLKTRGEVDGEVDPLERLLETHGSGRIIRCLAPFLTDSRKHRIEAVLNHRMGGVHLAVESPSNPHNAAAIVRTSEALGAGTVHVIAAEGRALRAQATTQGAYRWVETRSHVALQPFVKYVRDAGLLLVGAQVGTNNSLADVPVEQPLCLLFGNEQRGLSAEAMAACDRLYSVPMYGMSESLNLSVCAAVSLYDVVRRRRESGRMGDLGADQRERLEALYYLRSVDLRLALGVLARQSEI